MTELFRHVPVLLRETIDACITNRDGRYVDATGGGGGHSTELLSRLSEHGKLLIFDCDMQAIDTLNKKFSADKRVSIVQERFGKLRNVLKMNKWDSIDGLVADLGMSSHQLDSTERGFSMKHLSAPLDLRMELTMQTAAEWLAESSVKEIAEALEQGGDFHHTVRMAEPLHRAAKTNSHLTVGEAFDAAFGEASNTLPAVVRSRFLQAIRIAVNDEYGELRALLNSARENIVAEGKIAILTFHSGEAKIVKEEFIARAPAADPHRSNGERYWSAQKPIPAKAVSGERNRNPRAASAVLRSATRRGV